MTIEENYTDLVTTLRELGRALGPAVAVRYETPPGRAARDSTSQGWAAPDPTLDTVLDPRRLALSEEITATARALRQARAVLSPHVEALDRALARWEGRKGSDRP